MSETSKRSYEKIVAPAGNYIAGRFTAPKDPIGEIKVISPADAEDLLGVFPYSYADVETSVTAARDAFEIWSVKPLQERIEFLKKYRDALKRSEARLTEVIAREVGKPLWEAKQEVAAMVNKIDVTIADGLPRVADYEIPGIMPGTLGVCRYRPHGVFVVIGPFNFPGHLANGHLVPALMLGNTVIFKPSEKSPATAQIMAEAMHEAGLPKGVFNVVHGDGEVGRRLVTHEGIDGVLFTGSYEVGLKIKQDTLTQSWKLIALEMGGKNPSIVLEDANIDAALYEVLTSVFMTAGQRCATTSRVFVHRAHFDRFVERFHERAKKFSIGHPLDNPFMGPLIDEHSVEKYLKFLGIAAREGCEIIMRGKQLELEYRGHYVTPSICVVRDNSLASVKKSVYQQTEIFGPNVAFYSFDDPEEAIRLANATQYGLSAGIFTANKENFERVASKIRAGVINWNRSTVGASSRLPFGGVRRSGNHFPSGISVASYCVYPVASLEVAEPKLPEAMPPGLNW